MTILTKSPFGIPRDLIQAMVRQETKHYKTGRSKLIKNLKEVEEKIHIKKIVEKGEKLDDTLHRIVKKNSNGLIDKRIKTIKKILRK